MILLKQTGYYLSEPKHYEDWHAGHKIEHYNFIAYFFSVNGKAYKALKKNNNVFSKTDFLNENLAIDYSIDNDTIDFHYDKGSKYEYHKIFNIQNKHTMIGTRSIKYTWTPFPTEAEDKESSSRKLDS